MVNKKSPEKNKINFEFIKSDLEKKTKSLDEKEKINISKIKEYKNNLNYFLAQIKYGKKIEKDINKFKKNHYLSIENLKVLKNFESNEINYNVKNFLGSINIKDFFKNKKIDLFTISDFNRKILQLNENVVYKYKDIIGNKMRLNSEDSCICIKNSKFKNKNTK